MHKNDPLYKATESTASYIFKSGAKHTLITQSALGSLRTFGFAISKYYPSQDMDTCVFNIVDELLPAVFQVTVDPAHQHTLPRPILQAHPHHQY